MHMRLNWAIFKSPPSPLCVNSFIGALTERWFCNILNENNIKPCPDRQPHALNVTLQPDTHFTDTKMLQAHTHITLTNTHTHTMIKDQGHLALYREWEESTLTDADASLETCPLNPPFFFSIALCFMIARARPPFLATLLSVFVCLLSCSSFLD